MASSKEWNSDLDVKGKIKVTDMPNQTGKPVVWNPATDTLSVREPSEMINDYNLVTTSRTITAGTGLTGGGNLSSNRTLNVDFGTGSNQVARGNHEHSWGDINNKPTIPTNNNQLTNGAGYLSVNILGRATTPPNTVGWFRIATISRGTEQIALSFTGGSLTPHTYIVTYYKDWQNLQGRGNIIVEKHGNAGNYIPRFRLAESSDGETYLYGECVSRGSGLLIEVFQYSIKGYTSQSEVFIGELEQEDEVETIIYETDTVREGLNIKRVSSNSFVLNNSSNNEILLGGGSTQPLDELVTTNTNQTITGSKVFEGSIAVPNPTSSTHAVRKSYVDTGFFNKSGDTITNTEGGSITDMIKLYNRSIVDGTGAGIYAALSTNEEYYHGGLEVERTNTGGTHSTSTHLVARKTGSGTGKAFMERVLTVGYSGSTPFAATIAPFEADGIIKTGSSNNYLLLGGGGHTLLSTLMPSDASFNLKTNSLQRTTIGNGSDLDLIAGNNVSLSYGAGGKVTINSVDTNTNTTYTAGTGLSLSGTTFSLSGDSFDAGGNYATLRARGTTKADVSLGNVLNVASYSKVESDNKYLQEEEDPTVPQHVKSIAQGDINDWNEAFDKHTVSVSITGDTNKTITLTREDGTILTASFLDNNTNPEFPDDVINSLEFNINNDGVLTASTSEGTVLDVSLDGRYSLLNHTHSWGQITGKPTTFPPSAHNHDDRYYTETEIDTQLSTKSDITHTHTWSQVTGKPTTFPPSEHLHSEIEILDSRTLPESDGQSYMPSPNEVPGRRLSAYFSTTTGRWNSFLTLKGWSGDYHAWQLGAYAGEGSAREDLIFRVGSGDSWGTDKIVFHDGNLSPVTLDTSQTITGAKVFEGSIAVPNPTSGVHATRKSYVDSELSGKANTSGTYSGLRAQATTKADVGLSGIPNTNSSTSQYLRGDGTWVTPPNTNTTYSEITAAEANSTTSSVARLITGRRLNTWGNDRFFSKDGGVINGSTIIFPDTPSVEGAETIQISRNASGTTYIGGRGDSTLDWAFLLRNYETGGVQLQLNLGAVQAPDFVGTSDRRLKKDIQPLKPANLNTQYKTFTFKNDKREQERFGLIAQELEENHPEFIREDEKGIKSISYTDVHSAEIAYLKTRNEVLEDTVKKQDERIERLEKAMKVSQKEGLWTRIKRWFK